MFLGKGGKNLGMQIMAQIVMDHLTMPERCCPVHKEDTVSRIQYLTVPRLIFFKFLVSLLILSLSFRFQISSATYLGACPWPSLSRNLTLSG